MLWVDVVNGSLAWTDPEAARRFWTAAGAIAGCDSAALARLRSAASILRTAGLGRMLAPAAPAPAAAALWLTRLELSGAVPERRGGLALPALRARRTGSDLPPAVDEILSTALLDLFACARPEVVQRCAGVVRAGEVSRVDEDAEFERLAGLAGLLGEELGQCPWLVAAPRAGRYCSKTCSNAAFALRKAAREPRYFARKQASYRDRQRRDAVRQTAAARARSAFAFVD